MRFLNFIMGSMLLMDEKNDDKGGGGGGGGTDSSKDIAALKEQNAALLARLDALEKGKDKDKDKNDDPSLADKAKKERENQDAQAASQKAMESAINFNISSKDFVKNNGSLLPKTIESIFVQAEKQNYDSAIQKANAIKAAIISEVFIVKDWVEHLTGPQKIEVENFLKLTNNGKQERVDNIYSMIFEPTLEMVRKIEKAKQLNNGAKNQTDGEKALAERMMKMSKKHYLGEKDA
jgi:hypothetical protein